MMEFSFTPLIPFEPISAKKTPSGNNWIAQVKWDGVRMLAYYDGRTVKLINRKLNDKTEQYPEFLEPSAYCSSSSYILDGELIAFDENKPSFHEIMKRNSLRKQARIEAARTRTPVTYMIFDVLYVDGCWVLDKPLSARQQILSTIIKPQHNVQLVQSFANTKELFEVMRTHQMEGVVCKKLDSVYSIGGKDNRWQKIKIYYDLYAVVGGITIDHHVVNSLLLGLYDEQGNFFYIGHSGTGKLTNKEKLDITTQALSSATSQLPFIHAPERNQGAMWVTPLIVVKVQFMEWTPNHTMRHPTIQSVSKDVDRMECTIIQLQ
jgi:bifunctional non-homologous end joining protein LigD